MNQNVAYFPKQASSFAASVDNLYFFLIGVSVFFTILIGALVIYFIFRYRRRSDADRPAPVHGNTPLEITWTIIPLILVMIMFFWGAAIFYKQYRPPADAMEVLVTGKQWMWKLQHPSGRSEINMLHVPLGRPVKLTMTSEDVIHSFYIPAFRTKSDVVPGRYTTLWFTATELGEHHLFCAEYCGGEHSLMKGWVRVIPADEYDLWAQGLDADVAALTPVEAGRRLFTEQGCYACHNPESGALGPNIVGVFGSQVKLADGSQILADEAYLRESILYPQNRLVAGYMPVMPTYRGLLNETQLMQIIAYIKSVGAEE